MDAASRKRIVASDNSNGGDEDRLSELPDALIHTILTFLKARQVVQTSVLSTRWRHLWRSVPCLDIDQSEFTENEGEKFEDFADTLLAHRNGLLLDTFQLRIRGNITEHRGATRWIRRGLKCSPKELYFYDRVCCYVNAPMPKLDSNASFLRKLHLYNVQLYDTSSEQISSACALLEVLELKICRLSFQEITLPTLKNLVVDDCILDFSEDSDDDGPTDIDDELRIMAPHLSHLHVVLNVNDEKFSVGAMPSLIKATISLKYNNSEKMLSNQWQVVSNLFNATSLELSGFQSMVMPQAELVGFPVFKNLRSLLLYKCDLSDDFELLALFLLKSPELEKLTVHCCKFREGVSETVNLIDAQCVKLKSTKIIYGYGDCSYELINILLNMELPTNTITLTEASSDHQPGYY